MDALRSWVSGMRDYIVTGRETPATTAPQTIEQMRDRIEQLKQLIDTYTYDLRRDIRTMRDEEEKAMREARFAAKNGNAQSARTHARHVARYRARGARTEQQRFKLAEYKMKLADIETTKILDNTLVEVTRLLLEINKVTPPDLVQGVARVHQEQMAEMEKTQRIIDDAMIGSDSQESEINITEDQIYTSLISELLSDINTQLPIITSTSTTSTSSTSPFAELDRIESEMHRRKP